MQWSEHVARVEDAVRQGDTQAAKAAIDDLNRHVRDLRTNEDSGDLRTYLTDLAAGLASGAMKMMVIDRRQVHTDGRAPTRRRASAPAGA